MKSFLFDSLRQWRVCIFAGCKNFCWGLVRIISCIILGVLSVIRAVWRVMVGFVRKYPNIALGISIAVCILVWMLTFASMRARAVGAEDQRDSISYQFREFKRSHGYE